MINPERKVEKSLKKYKSVPKTLPKSHNDDTTFYSRTKHIAIHYHYIHETFNEGIIVLMHRGTDDMPTDMFTKALIRVKLTKFAQSVGVFST